MKVKIDFFLICRMWYILFIFEEWLGIDYWKIGKKKKVINLLFIVYIDSNIRNMIINFLF